MYDHYQNTKISDIRREDIRREIEQQRMARTNINADVSEEPMPFYAPILSSVGDALVNAGSALKERYSDVRDAYDSAPRAGVRPSVAK